MSRRLCSELGNTVDPHKLNLKGCSAAHWVKGLTPNPITSKEPPHTHIYMYIQYI